MTELRQSARLLARTPGFTLSVSLLLALGIGASTIVFSFFNAVLLKPLDLPHPEELVRFVQRLPQVGVISSFPEPYHDALRDRATTLALTFGETGQYDRFALTAPAPAESLAVRGVTPMFFEALGIQPLYGRVLGAIDDQQRSETRPALLSYRLWRRRFDASPDVVGRTLAVNGRSFAIVGVMPEGFNGITIDTGPDVWLPLSAYRTLIPADYGSIEFELAGRLKPGVMLSQAEAEGLGLWQSTMTAYYQDVEQRSDADARQLVARGIELQSLGRGVSVLRDSFDSVLKILSALTLLLLLIVCLNVGGILIARAAARQHELAVRLALGASPMMLIRQLLAEGVLLSILGGVGGVFLAAALIPLAKGALPPIRDRSGALLPLTLAVSIDWQVIAFVAVVIAIATLCFSAAPAVFIRRVRIEAILRAARSTSARQGHESLILIQVALCTFLLLTAGLFVRSLQQLRNVDTGFNINQIATFTGDLGTRTGGDASAFLSTLSQRIREIPGVRAVSASSVAVMRGRGVFWTVAPAGERITKAHFLNASGNTVSADYFETMEMRIVRGRGLTDRSDAQVATTAPVQAVVNQAFVMKFFQGVEPIAQRFGTPVNGVATGRYEIVGVVNDARYRSLREPVPPTFYALGTPADSFVMNVRASVRPDAIIEPVRKALAAVDPMMPFREVHTMSEEVEASMANERLTAALASSVGLCAALFAAAGIYGSLAYIATQRRREIAIRLALGAGRLRTAVVMVKRTLAMVLAGIVLGLSAALAATSAFRSLLFNISPQDTQAIASTLVFVAVVASAATAVPLVRATRTEPAEGLRLEP